MQKSGVVFDSTYLLELRFLLIDTLLEGHVALDELLEALFVPVLDCLHLKTQVLHCLVQVLDDERELILLLRGRHLVCAGTLRALR